MEEDGQSSMYQALRDIHNRPQEVWQTISWHQCKGPSRSRLPKHIVVLQFQTWFNSSSIVIASDATFYPLRMNCD